MNAPHETPPPPHEILFGMIAGVWAGQSVGALCRLGIPDAIAAGCDTAEAVAAKLAFDGDATDRLMRACAAAGILLRPDERRFALSPLGELLRSDVPDSLRSFMDVQTAPGHWLAWGRLDARVKTGESQVETALGSDIWSYFQKNPQEGRTFAEAMGGLSASGVAAVLDAHDFGDPKKVVDVGGSHGTFLAALLGRHAAARGVLFDLPHVLADAEGALSGAGVADRIELAGGSFLDAVPEGGDLYLLKHILHDWDDAACRRILENCRRAMAPGGKVAVVEMVIGGHGDPPGPAPFLDLNMMVLLPGRERTVAEFAALFESAGLRLGRVVPTASPMVLLEASAR